MTTQKTYHLGKWKTTLNLNEPRSFLCSALASSAAFNSRAHTGNVLILETINLGSLLIFSYLPLLAKSCCTIANKDARAPLVLSTLRSIFFRSCA